MPLAITEDHRALAEVAEPDAPVAVDEVERRPVLVGERAPDRVVVVDRNRVVDPHRFHGLADVVYIMFE